MSERTNPTVYAGLTYADALAAIAWLEAVGFERRELHADENDPSHVLHAEYAWGPRGAIMFGSKRRENPDGFVDTVGHGQAYCVTQTDEEVDAAYDRAMAAGATSLRPPEDMPYGGRGATVLDPEGNQWSFGSYPGA